MQCPRCQQTFKFITIPLADRVIEAGSTRFICPCRRAWLKPSRKYTYLTVLGSLGIAVPVVLYAIAIYLGKQVGSENLLELLVLLIAGIALLIYGAIRVELNVVGELEENSDIKPD